MPSGNDANNYIVAVENCLYCAIGGLVGKPASEIMQMVFNLLGEAVPKGTNADDTGADGFGKLYWKCVKKSDYQKGTDSDPVRYQIAGVKYFLNQKGCRVTNFGTADQPKTFKELLKFAQAKPKFTRFLAFAGDADFGTFVTTLAHWTVGQVQDSGVVFYDHQLNVTDTEVAKMLARTFRNKGIKAIVGETREGYEPLGPLGQELDAGDKRGILLIVEK